MPCLQTCKRRIDTSTRWIARYARFGRTGSRDGLASTPVARAPKRGLSFESLSRESPLFESSCATATWTSRPLRSEREDLEWDRERCQRPHRPRERYIPPGSTLLKPYPIQDSGCFPRLPRTRSPEQPVKACLEAASLSSHCREERPVRRPDMADLAAQPGTRRRPFASVIAATPRALNPYLINLVDPALCPSPERDSRRNLFRDKFGWAYRKISVTSGAGPSPEGGFPCRRRSRDRFPSDPRFRRGGSQHVSEQHFSSPNG